MMSKLKVKISLSLIGMLLIMAGCDSGITNDDRSVDNLKVENLTESLQEVSDPDLNQTLDEVRSATAPYHDVENAEGYEQTSPFVPGMGYHYVNPGLVDDKIDPAQPEALVYVDNPQDDDNRRLVAVEYIIPYGIIPPETSHSAFDDKFPGVDGDKWHKEDEISAWTLHAWIWYPNPEGLFHSTNPRVGSGN